MGYHKAKLEGRWNLLLIGKYNKTLVATRKYKKNLITNINYDQNSMSVLK